jgi:hypothetical protein
MCRKVIISFPVIVGLCLITAFFSGTLGFGYSPRVSQLQVSEEEFAQWVKERAIHLDTLDSKNIDLSMLSPLDKDRNFVANGSLAHGFIKSQADAIFFVSEVTPIRERKKT